MYERGRERERKKKHRGKTMSVDVLTGTQCVKTFFESTAWWICKLWQISILLVLLDTSPTYFEQYAINMQ